MNKLIAWSGGLDSTALVWKSLLDGHKVKTIYIEIPGNGEKVKREQAAMVKMMEFMKPYPIENLYKSTIDLTVQADIELAQPAVWLLGLAYACKPDIEEVNVGYVLSDQAVSWIPEIKALWNSYSGLMRKPLPPLEFPLIKWDKRDLWNLLPPELRAHATWCESSSGPHADPEKLIIVDTPCGSCVPCRRMKFLDLFPQSLSDQKVDNIVDPNSIPFYP